MSRGEFLIGDSREKRRYREEKTQYCHRGSKDTKKATLALSHHENGRQEKKVTGVLKFQKENGGRRVLRAEGEKERSSPCR